MSILYFALFLLLAYFFQKNFEKTLICYAPFKLIVHKGIYLFDSAFAINLDLAITSFAFLIFIINRYKYRKIRLPNTLVVTSIIFVLGEFIAGMNPRFVPNIFFYEPVCSILYLYMLFKIIRYPKQIKLLIRYLIIVAFILVFDALFDVLTGYNPITALEESQAGPRFWVSHNDIMRAGISRTTSFMPHSIAMGTVASLIWGLLLALLLKYPSYYTSNTKVIYAILLLPLCVIFANSRTSILISLCFLPLLFSRKVFFTRRLFLILIVISICFFFFQDYFDWFYNSIFNESKVEVAGSSTDLRKRQLEVALFYFSKKPIFGQGADFNVLLFESEKDVMGMESLWFQLLMFQGLVGLCTYLQFFVVTAYHSLYTNKIFILFTVAWLVSVTLSSQVGVSILLYGLIFLINYKIHIFNLANNKFYGSNVIYNNTDV